MSDDTTHRSAPDALEALPLPSAEAWEALALALPPLPPPSALRDRILAAVERAAPYRSFLPRLAACFGLTEPGVHGLLARMSDPTAWTPGMGPTLAFLHFESGPALQSLGASPHCGIARMRSGAQIPRHEHKGREVTFVLEGSVTDDAGRRFGPGQVLDMPAGSTHALRVTGAAETLLAVLLAEIEIVVEA